MKNIVDLIKNNDMENYNDVNAIEFKIRNCIENFEYMKTFILSDEERVEIEKYKDLIFVYNKSFDDAKLAFFNSLRKIFAKGDGTKTFDELDGEIRNRYNTLKENAEGQDGKGGVKKYINTQVLHTDSEKVALMFINFDDMYENIVKHLYNLFKELTEITFEHVKFEDGEIKITHTIQFPGYCKNSIIELINYRKNKVYK